jgi:hypothetical protein
VSLQALSRVIEEFFGSIAALFCSTPHYSYAIFYYRSPSATVRGSSFEDAKKNMASELQAQIEAILREHPKKSARRIA